jgi:uncharacterized protein (TIGR03437 family)
MFTYRWLVLTCAVLGGACLWGQSDTGAAASIASLNAQILDAPNGQATEPLLRSRFRLLRELIRSDPERALELALPDDMLASLRGAHASLDAQLERRGQWEGKSYVLVEDSADLRTSRKSLRMHSPEGDLRIYLGPSAATLPGTRMYRVEGVRAGDDVAARTVVALDATAAADSCSTTGNQKTLAILATMPGSLEPTFTLDQVQDWMFGSSLSLDGYWRDASYGKTSASGAVVGWIDLSHTYTIDQTTQIQQDIFQRVAAQGVDLTQYSRFFLFVPQWQNQGMIAGLSTLGCTELSQAGTTFDASVAWVSETSSATPVIWLSAVIHEAGHGLGLDHSVSLTCGAVPLGPAGDDCPVFEYGDPYSEMGEGFLGHYAAPQKYALGWLSNADVSTAIISGTAHLLPLSAQGSGTKALRIPRTIGGSDWLWLEARGPVGVYETSSLQTRGEDAGGAVIHFQPEEPAGPVADLTRTQLVAMPHVAPIPGGPVPPGADLAAGSSWTDVFSGLTVSVAQGASSALDVTVTRDSQCATLVASSATINGDGGTGTIQVNAPMGCSWLATSAYGWLTIQGSAPGTGSGTVTYRAAANGGIMRQGVLMIGSRGVLITQPAGSAPPVIVGADPRNFAGSPVSLTLTVSDEAPGNLATVRFNITDGSPETPTCMVTWDAVSQNFRLMNDDGITSITSAAGYNMDIENSHCAILSGFGEHVGQNDTQLALVFRAAWKGATAGAQVIYLRATDLIGNDTGWQSVGSWTPTVNHAPAQPALADDPGAGFQHAFVIQATDPDGASDVHRIELDIGNGFYRCSMIYLTDQRGVEFLDDDGSRSGWLAGNPTVATGKYCSLDLLRTVVTASGNTLTLILPVTFTSALAGNQPVQVIVTDWAGATGQLTSSWTVAASGDVPTISAAGIVNGASWTGGAISFGEIVTIFGNGLGPKTLQKAAYIGNELQQTVAGTTVFFDGLAAPLLYVSDSAVSAIVPPVFGNSISVEVASHGGISNIAMVPAANETPGIFAYPNSLQAVAVNQDGSYNADKPAARGSYVTFFITGFGLCVYDSAEFTDVGAIPPASPWAYPQFPVFVQFGNNPAYQAAFAGLAWPGVVQVNAAVDWDAPTGDAVPLTVVFHEPSFVPQSGVMATVRLQ